MADEKKAKSKAKPKKVKDRYARVGFVQATKSVKKEK
tara:strand:+ start:642 stop:752 length:111 start_codon:yes stop_codon:yes gene_type:complete